MFLNKFQPHFMNVFRVNSLSLYFCTLAWRGIHEWSMECVCPTLPASLRCGYVETETAVGQWCGPSSRGRSLWQSPELCCITVCTLHVKYVSVEAAIAGDSYPWLAALPLPLVLACYYKINHKSTLPSGCLGITGECVQC